MGWCPCLHLWKFSSFHKWVKQGKYLDNWGCVGEGKAGCDPGFWKDERIDGKWVGIADTWAV